MELNLPKIVGPARKCPRCGSGRKSIRKPAMRPGENPWQYGAGMLVLCDHAWHEER